MSTSLLLDNWLLQDVGECLSRGLSHDFADEVVVDRATATHSLQEVAHAGVQIEALFDLLSNIVFRDALITDSKFTDAWTEFSPSLQAVIDPGLLRGVPLYSHEDQLEAPRAFAVGQLCVTPSLLEVQRRNEESWKERQEADDPYMSQVIWGTAGMLSRSHVFEAIYCGHPLRKRILEQALGARPQRDMVTEITDWICTQRLRLYEGTGKDTARRIASVTLPPAVVDIIEEAEDVSKLIPIAYQMRDRYADIREWMKAIQDAAESENAKRIARYKRTLNAVSRDIDRKIGAADRGNITVTIGFGFPRISIPLMTLEGAMKPFGMRATLNNHIFSQKGEGAFKKLLRMFDEESSGVGLAARDYITRPR